MPKYFTDKNLNFSSRSEEDRYYGLSLDETKLILDCIAVSTYSHLVQSGMADLNIILKRPFHCIVVETDEFIVYGVSNDRCVLGNNMISCGKEIYTNENVVNTIKESSIKELGFETKNFIWVKKAIIYKYKDLISLLVTFEDTKEVMSELAKPMNIALLMEFFICSQKFFRQIIKEENILNMNPVFKARNLTVDENLCFCVLPFDDERLEIFNDLIKPELEKEFGLIIIRADNIFSNNDIMEDIWTYICKSRFVIADVSLKNPNVFYELGICHTIGKEVITICDESSLQDDYNGRLPFDIQSRRTIFYKNSGSGPKRMIEDLKNTVRSIIDGKTVLF